jgi:hypothetical protein
VAQELVKEEWFLDELQVLTAEGNAIWDGKTSVRVRIATETEGARYRDIAAEAAEENGDVCRRSWLRLRWDNAPR